MKRKKQIVLKISSAFLAAILIINLVLLGLKKIDQRAFWMIVAVIALLAYKVMPKINKKQGTPQKNN